MPVKKLESVLVIGSGPIIIGQAAEFDYSGTQACKAIKEEGIEVILVNSNPATIMTDQNIADKIYLEPLTVDYIEKIIKKENPDGLLPTLGGQTGLNLAVELAEKGVLAENNIDLLGTDLATIQKAEDREKFRQLLQDLKEPVIDSDIVSNYREAEKFVDEIGFPVIIRPAYTLGGSGGGIAENKSELKQIVELGLNRSRIGQVIIEESIKGWKELEYEVIRDKDDNCITVCNMENIDPVGVHTGDSIVVAPSQTLTDREYQKLRAVSIKIIRALGVEGGCNIQFALDPETSKYYIIEVNPRVSRSSALASKATGYPIARVSAKIALGFHLDEIKNRVTNKTYACFEPALDYVVTKIPRWPFDKFIKGKKKLGTQMKATGEVMAIGRNFTESFLKALESLDLDLPDFTEEKELEVLKESIIAAEDNRIFAVLQAIFNEISPELISEWTGMDPFYLYKFKCIAEKYFQIRDNKELLLKEKSFLLDIKKTGFSDRLLAGYIDSNTGDIRRARKKMGIIPVYKMVDTCASEFVAETPYYYSTYEEEDEVERSGKRKVLVIGSGPIRIGQGIEFDYSSVQAVNVLQKKGLEAIIVNNNPETVSTDFDTGGKLYFEPLTPEFVLNVIDKEGIEDVILQFGGQTSINLAETLADNGINILGTPPEKIDLAEDREQFYRLLSSSDIPTPTGFTAYTIGEALTDAEELGYPVLVRPSYVLGGRGMEVVYRERELLTYLKEAVKISPRYPVLIDRYIIGKEVEVDAIADGKKILIPGIVEHIERAGVHSGDSMAVYPPQDISSELQDQLVQYTRKIVRKMGLKGLINIQFVIDDQDNIYVLEVNPRASRTIPILSKVTGVPMVEWAVEVMLGKSLREITPVEGLLPESSLVSVKSPVFSMEKLPGVDVHLSPEMKSTGEVLGTDIEFSGAVYKSLLAAGFSLPHKARLLFSLADRDKKRGSEIAAGFVELGYDIFATTNTAKYFIEKGIKVKQLDTMDLEDINMVVNTPTRGKQSDRMGFKLRRKATENNIDCFTSLATVEIILKVQKKQEIEGENIYRLQEYYQRNQEELK